MKYIRSGHWFVHHGEDAYAVDAHDKSKRIHLTDHSVPLADARPCPVRVSYPQLTEILQDSNIVVSNSLVASQVRTLVYVIMDAGYPDGLAVEYAPNSVYMTNHIWNIIDGYWGGPDDWHRRPSKVVHRIFVDQTGLLTNFVSDVYPRPMDMESWKHRTNASTPTNEPAAGGSI
jgi:hypothetical protein